MYDSQLVQPMRDEVTRLGISELRSAAEVDRYFSQREGTALLFVNSVCGCAAGSARPALAQALQHPLRPDRLATVFAGQDAGATARARAYFPEIPPSSPSLYFLKDNELVLHIPRQAIEGRDASAVAQDLVAAFDTHCHRGDQPRHLAPGSRD